MPGLAGPAVEPGPIVAGPAAGRTGSCCMPPGRTARNTGRSRLPRPLRCLVGPYWGHLK